MNLSIPTDPRGRTKLIRISLACESPGLEATPSSVDIEAKIQSLIERNGQLTEENSQLQSELERQIEVHGLLLQQNEELVVEFDHCIQVRLQSWEELANPQAHTSLMREGCLGGQSPISALSPSASSDSSALKMAVELGPLLLPEDESLPFEQTVETCLHTEEEMLTTNQQRDAIQTPRCLVARRHIAFSATHTQTRIFAKASDIDDFYAELRESIKSDILRRISLSSEKQRDAENPEVVIGMDSDLTTTREITSHANRREPTPETARASLPLERDLKLTARHPAICA